MKVIGTSVKTNTGKSLSFLSEGLKAERGKKRYEPKPKDRVHTRHSGWML